MDATKLRVVIGLLFAVLCFAALAAGLAMGRWTDVVSVAHSRSLKCCEVRLAVQSRSEVGRIVSESARLVCPGITDVFVRRQASQGLQPLGKVVRVKEGSQVVCELTVGLVMISPDSGLLECSVHPLNLAVGPGMIRFSEPVFDVMLATDTIEHMKPIARGWT
jgi:hypothetical protein